MYFVDDQHELNFKQLLFRWQIARNNPEYKVACYITSVPIIFEKIKDYIGTSDTPVEWIWDWEWAHTLSKLPEYAEDEEPEESEIPYDLTSSMVQLGKLALNLWNGYEHFNLMRCIEVLDEEHYKIVKCAMDMRIGI